MPEGSELIGSWLCDQPGYSGRFTIFRKDGKYYLEWLSSWPSHERNVKELYQRPTEDGFDFQTQDKGDHYLLNRFGSFFIRDRDDDFTLRGRKIR